MILTGGASAVYGSDAIAGVVNFIMNDHFQGVQLDVSHSWYNHEQHSPIGDVVAAKEATNPANFHKPGDASSDGEADQYSLIIGGNFDGNKGNATVFLGYQKQKPLLQSQRDFSACSLAATFGDGFACAGSSNTAPAKFTLPNGSAFRSPMLRGVRGLFQRGRLVQLRSVQLLPGTGRALERQRLRAHP